MERTRTRTRTYGTATRALSLLGAALLVGACSPNGADGAGAGEDAEENGRSGGGAAGVLGPGQPEDLVTGLDVPWGIDFLPDGSALVAQRDSAVVTRVSPDGEASEAGTVDGVAHGGEGGLLGLAVDPDFPEEPYAYVYYTTGSDNRVSRMEYDADANSLGDPEVVLEGIPAANTHNGGRIEFGPDGYLYVATGDGGGQDDPDGPPTVLGLVHVRDGRAGQHPDPTPDAEDDRGDDEDEEARGDHPQRDEHEGAHRLQRVDEPQQLAPDEVDVRLRQRRAPQQRRVGLSNGRRSSLLHAERLGRERGRVKVEVGRSANSLVRVKQSRSARPPRTRLFALLPTAQPSSAF